MYKGQLLLKTCLWMPNMCNNDEDGENHLYYWSVYVATGTGGAKQKVHVGRQQRKCWLIL